MTSKLSIASSASTYSADDSDVTAVEKQVVSITCDRCKSCRKCKKRKAACDVIDLNDTADAKGDADQNTIKPVPFVSLFRFATRTEVALMIFACVLAAGAGAAQPAMTIIFADLTNLFTNFGIVKRTIAGEGMSPELAKRLEAASKALVKEAGHCSLYLLAIGLGTFLCTYAYMLIFNYTSEVQSRRLREQYLAAVLRQEIAWFDDTGAGEIATRIQSDCLLVQTAISEKIGTSLQCVSSFLTGFIVAFSRNPRLAAVITTILPVIIIAGTVVGIFDAKYQVAALELVSKAGSVAEEAISSIRTVQAFASISTVSDRFNKYIDGSRTSGIRGSLGIGIGLAVLYFTVYMPYALAFVYGGQLVAHGKADAGTVLNVFFAILIGSFSIAMLAPALQSISKGRAAASKLFETIDRVPPIDSANASGLKPDNTSGDIKLTNVNFHYPSRPDIPILKNVCTSFEAGKVTALVGGSGSGKSTIISLVERFYDPIDGSSITLDGNELRSLNLTWLRQQIGLVSQEPTLFATTVRGNVEHGLIGSVWEHASEEERLARVKSACVAANADGFITKLPLGYETVVGDRGMLLSGGQKQRIAIARAIVSNPRILLLDEATSALDGHSERVVQDALDKASVGRTTIVVAHRLATIRNADKILVMNAGEVAEEGTHSSLLELNGQYATLVQNQKLQKSSKPELEADSVDDDEIVTEAFTISNQRGAPLHRSNTSTSISGQILRQRSAAAVEVAADTTAMGFFAVFRRLWQMNKPYWRWYAAGTVGSVASGMVYPAMSILFGKAIADFELPANLIRPALYRKALWYFIVAILASASRFVNFYMFARTGHELVAKLRKRFFGSVLRHDIEWFDDEKNAAGAVTANLASQPQNVHGLFGVTLGAILSAITTLVGGCIIGLCYGPLLSLIGIGCIPLIISSGYIRLRVVVTKEEKTRKWQSSSAQMASEASAAVRTVASLTREAQVCDMYSKSLEEPMRISNRVAVRAQALYAASQGIMFLVIALVFYIGALWIANGWYTTSMFYTSLTSVIFATLEAGDVFQYVPDASRAVSAARSIFESVDTVPVVDADSADGIVLDPKKVQGHITFSNVHFRYPTRPDVRVLRNLNLEVPAGKYIALVGPSGCGKSTLIGLLERFYDPLMGQITLDGTDIRQLNVASYRAQLGLVSQEPTLYTGTIRSNLIVGATAAITDEQLVQACTEANIYDFIMSLPDGFETEVGGKGAQLSGGQKQRIAIARALVRDPKILLLDEVTAALDSNSERVVQAALDNVSKGRSVISIAHRLSSIQNADLIYFISEGGVLEKGNHAELLARRGAYCELVKTQTLNQAE